MSSCSGEEVAFTQRIMFSTKVITLLFKREVFEEAAHFLEGLFAGAGQGTLVIERITSPRFAEAWKLRKRFHDKPSISFTDLTSMTLMR